MGQLNETPRTQSLHFIHIKGSFEPSISTSSSPNDLNDSHGASSRLLDIDDMEPRVCLVEDIFERRGCSLVAVELGEHGEIDVAIIHHVSNHHLKYQTFKSQDWISRQQHLTTHRGYFSVQSVSGPSFNNHSNSTTLAPSLIAGTSACRIRTAYLSLQSCKIHRKK